MTIEIKGGFELHDAIEDLDKDLADRMEELGISQNTVLIELIRNMVAELEMAGD